MIEITLYFKQLELVVITIYIPLNNKIAGRNIQQKIVETVLRRKRQTQIIVMGDFNHTVDNILDRQHPQTTNYKRLPIFSWMKKQDFRDTYRDLNPIGQQFTWSNGEAATRIDYIWISDGLVSGLQKAEVEEVEDITESDHKIITAEIWIKHIIAVKSKAEIKKKRQSRTIYLYDQAKLEDWENYAQELQKRLETKEVLKDIHKKEQNEKRKAEKINNIWDIIEEAIITAANKHIPKKKVFNTINNRRKRNQKERQQEENIVKLQKLIKHAKAKKTQAVTEEKKVEVKKQLKILGKKIGTKLPRLQRQ